MARTTRTTHGWIIDDDQVVWRAKTTDRVEKDKRVKVKVMNQYGKVVAISAVVTITDVLQDGSFRGYLADTIL